MSFLVIKCYKKCYKVRQLFLEISPGAYNPGAYKLNAYGYKEKVCCICSYNSDFVSHIVVYYNLLAPNYFSS